MFIIICSGKYMKLRKTRRNRRTKKDRDTVIETCSDTDRVIFEYLKLSLNAIVLKLISCYF